MIRVARIMSAVAAITRLFSFALLIPIPIALLYEPWDDSLFGFTKAPGTVGVFLAAFVVCCAFWIPARLATRRVADQDLLDREAYLTMAVGWLVVTAFAMLPFLLSRSIASPLDAFFEAMSGLTGTGSTAMHGNLEGVPGSIVWWRAFTQWVGGLGIIILTVALLSKLTHGGLQLFRGEAGTSTASRIKPKVAEVARGLWRMYGVITLLFIAVLAAVVHFHAGVPAKQALFDSMVGTFSAYGNGAFTSPGLDAVLGDGWVQVMLAVMMVAGATNFTLTFLLVRRAQARPLLANPEWRFFAVWTFAAVAVTTGILALQPGAKLAVLHDGAFTAISLATGAGLAAGHALWPQAAMLVLLVLVLVGGTAGSAAGGIKAFRALVLIRLVGRELRQLLHPRAILPLRVGSRVVPEGAVSAVIAFFFTFLGLWLMGSFLLLLFEPNPDLVAATGASLAALSNVGVGFGALAGGTASLAPASKLVLVALMWIGRMEIFAALLVFTPRSWRN